MSDQVGAVDPKRVGGWAALVFGILAGIIAFILVLILVANTFGRWQARADAHNRVTITQIGIQNANEAAKIVYAQIAATRAEAKKTYVQSVGVRRAQDEISHTLTPLYIQYEAIKAEEQIATSGKNNTIIYVPASQGGVPVISNAGAGNGNVGTAGN